MRKLLLAALIYLSAASIAWSQGYRTQSLTIVVPVAPGASTDLLARLLAEHMKVSLGRPVIVENTTGAGGSIGVARVARAPADGNTLSIGNLTTHVGASLAYPVKYDVLADFEPVARLTDTSMMLVGKSSLPAKNLAELIAWLNVSPNKASAATVGVGSPAHLCAAEFQSKTSTLFGLVPYRGGAPAVQDVIAGQIDLFCGEASNLLPHVRAGTVRAYAMANAARYFAAPDIPTMAEAGVPGMDIPFWHGLWTPKGTPKDVIAKLHAAVADALSDPAFRQHLSELGHIIPATDRLAPEAFRKHHAAEMARWLPVIRDADSKGQ